MQPILLIILVGLAGGVAVGLQSPLASTLTQRLGMWESIFIVHAGGTLLSLIPILYFGGGRLKEWRSVPWYALLVGVFGLVVIAAISYMIPRIGVTGSIITVVAGQMLIGVILDHFGWLGVVERPLDAPRLLGLGILMLGVWLTVR